MPISVLVSLVDRACGGRLAQVLGVGPDFPLFEFLGVDVDAGGRPVLYEVPDAPETAHFAFAEGDAVDETFVFVEQLHVGGHALRKVEHDAVILGSTLPEFEHELPFAVLNRGGGRGFSRWMVIELYGLPLPEGASVRRRLEP